MTGQRVDHWQEAPGHRILRAGDVVEVPGMGGGRWRIVDFRLFEDPTRPVEVTVVGGRRKHFRTVTIDRIGARKELAS